MRRLYLECNLRDTQNIYSLTGMPASAWFLQRQVPFLLMHCQINTTLISSRSLITRVTLFIRQDQCHGSVPDYPLGPAIVNLVCNLDKIRNRCCPLIFGLTAITMPCFCVCLWAVLISELSGIKKKTRLFHLSADEIALLSILLCFSIGRLAKKIHINNFFFFFRYEAFIEKSKWISICFKSNTKKKWPSTYNVYSFLTSQEQPAQANISNICTGLEILCFLLTVLQPPAVLAHFKPLQRGIAACMTCGNTKVLRAVHSLLSRLMSIFPTEPSKLQWFISKFSLEARPAAHRKKHYISDSFLRNRHATLW